MTILDADGVQSQIDAMQDSIFDIQRPEKGSIVCPITDKHVVLAMNYFSNTWKPGVRFDFLKLSRESACRDDGGPRDFTADGIPVGRKLSVKQIKQLFALFLAECDKRFPPTGDEG